jgi:hypothetical protein
MKSKLPQRRKSAEEIARLRESLGVPEEPANAGAGPRSMPAPPQSPPAGRQSRRAPLPAIPEQKPKPDPAPGPEPTHDPKPELKPEPEKAPEPKPEKPEKPRKRAILLEPAPKPTEKAGVTKLPAPLPAPELLAPPPGMERGPKPVRSLKRSERMPAPAKAEKKIEPRPDSPLPDRRHELRELQSIRAKNAMMVKPPVEQVKSLAAHPALVILGYLLAFGGGVGGLLVALYLFLKKPRSSHHAAFITIISLLVLVFGILYYIPQPPDAP